MSQNKKDPSDCLKNKDKKTKNKRTKKTWQLVQHQGHAFEYAENLFLWQKEWIDQVIYQKIINMVVIYWRTENKFR